MIACLEASAIEASESTERLPIAAPQQTRNIGISRPLGGWGPWRHQQC